MDNGTQRLTPARRPQVAEYLEELKINIDMLEEQLVRLQERLEPITRPEEQNERNPKQLEEGLVPLAFSLKNLNDKVKETASNVANLVERIEV